MSQLVEKRLKGCQWLLVIGNLSAVAEVHFQGFCRFHRWCFETAITTASWLVVALACDRLIAVVFPLKVIPDFMLLVPNMYIFSLQKWQTKTNFCSIVRPCTHKTFLLWSSSCKCDGSFVFFRPRPFVHSQIQWPLLSSHQSCVGYCSAMICLGGKFQWINSVTFIQNTNILW